MATKSQTQSKDKTETNEKEGHFVLITTTHGKPRRRAGLSFTPEGTRVDISKIDDKQKEAIQSDPVLKVKKIAD